MRIRALFSTLALVAALSMPAPILVVERNQSGFVRLALDDAQARLIRWPHYE